MFAEGERRAASHLAHEKSARSFEGERDGVGEPLPRTFPAEGHPVHQKLDRVLPVSRKLYLLVEVARLSVDSHPKKPFPSHFLELLSVHALSSLDHGGVDRNGFPARFPLYRLHHALPGPGGYLLPAFVAHGLSGDGEKHAHVVVYLRYGSDGGTGISVKGFLVDRHGRRESLHEVDVGLVEPFDELSRVGGKGLHEPPLRLGEKYVENEGGLSRTAHSRDDGEASARDLRVHVLEVVLSRACYVYELQLGRLPPE